MKFIHILPAKFINNSIAQTSDTQLILAHMLKDKEYLSECRKFKGIKILDNSFYELRQNPYDVDSLIRLAKKSKSQIICMPDTVFIDEKQFYDAHVKMAGKIKKAGFNVMAAVTSDKDFITELTEFKILNMVEEIDMIAIPYVLRDNGDALKRWYFLNLIEDTIPEERMTKQYHLFGCNSFYNLKLEKRKWIASIDGTMPFKEAYYREPLPVSLKKEHKRPEDYFHIKKLDSEQMNILRYNIKTIIEACRDKNGD